MRADFANGSPGRAAIHGAAISSRKSSTLRRSVRRAEPPEVEAINRPITVRLTEDFLHELMRHQAEMRCKHGARLGGTNIGGVIDTLLRGPLGCRSES
jgi:hypothetical protein